MKILDVVILLLSVVNAQKELSEDERNASQSSDFYYEQFAAYMTADLAISGRPGDIFTNGACSGTLNTQYVAWWMFTFPVDTVFITNVIINYRPNTLYRFAGYSLYVSNSSTSKTDGYLCYHHTGPVLPLALQDVNCNHLGQYVIIYNERIDTVTYPSTYDKFAILELCKVRIYGCYKGWWDSTCSTPCPVNCIGDHCLPGNGSCVWECDPYNCLNDICDTATGKCTQGCKIGLRGDYCDKPCSLGTFGNQCSSICHCVNQPCNPIIGTCPAGGCQPGYKGDTCSTECSPGRYGYNCNQSCDGCLSDSCDKEHGVCTDTTCKPGWQYGQPWKCDKVCESRTFGNNCSENCYCVSQRQCNKATGVCPVGGCERGYKGITCSTDCSSGHYGYNCDKLCDGCLSDSCDKEYGVCTDTTGCKPGWQYGQLKCDKVCESRTFGNNCSENCYCVSQQPCNKTTGTCPVGVCERGYKGITCSTECSLGHYAFNCDRLCDGCLSDFCDREFGLCTNTSGCKPGRLPGGWGDGRPRCDIDCNDGTFGDGCLLRCHCQNGFCDKISGICPDNLCQPGWKRDSCSEACDDGFFGDRCATQCYCESDACNKATGKCSHDRCQPGWMGDTCSEECSRGFYGFNCANLCNTCNITLCERFEGNCTYGCIEGYTGYQCLSSVKSQSDGQTTNDNTMNMVYTGIVTFIVTALMCVIIVLVILRYRRGITCGDAKKQNGQNTRGYLNDAFTNDYANVGHNAESHYEETIPSAQEHTYDTI